MELIGRILDGSIPQDLREALRRAQPSGSRVSNDEKMRHLEDVPLLADRLWADAAARVGSRARLGEDLVAALAPSDW